MNKFVADGAIFGVGGVESGFRRVVWRHLVEAWWRVGNSRSEIWDRRYDLIASLHPVILWSFAERIALNASL